MLVGRKLAEVHCPLERCRRCSLSQRAAPETAQKAEGFTLPCMQPTTTITTRVAVPGVESEQLQAHQIGRGHFVVASVPFVDTTLAMGDIVECVTVGGAFHVDRAVVRGGASTVRVLPEDPEGPEGQDPNEIAGTLLAFGCHVELGPGGMLAASIGADCPREGITEWLSGLEAQGAIQLAPGYMA